MTIDRTTLNDLLHPRYVDWTFWGLFIVLIIIDILALFSAGSTLVYERGSILGPVGAQFLYLVLGCIVAYGMQLLPSRWIRVGGYILWLLSLLCLYVILIPGNPFVVTLNGAARWMRLGITFQPSELGKLGLIIAVSTRLASIQSDEDQRKAFFHTLIMTAITVLPIMTGNLSTAVLLAAIVFLLWLLSGISWRYWLPTLGISVGALIVGYFVVKLIFITPKRELHGPFYRAVTWVGRIDKMIEEKKQPAAEFRLTDDNYQRSIAKVAVARGGKTPLGVGPGNSQERDFLPQAFADYIFAIIVEETGFIGAAFLIFIYLAILFRACYASTRFSDYGAMLLMMGLALMLTCQALLSMMVAVGIGPVTGQPLPLISRGGTSVLITSMYFGIMLNISREQMMLQQRQQAVKEKSENDVPDIELDIDF